MARNGALDVIACRQATYSKRAKDAENRAGPCDFGMSGSPHVKVVAMSVLSQPVQTSRDRQDEHVPTAPY